MTTNQSFIRAYRQDVAEPAPLRPTSAAHHVAALPGTSVEIVTVGGPQYVQSHESVRTPAFRDDHGPEATVWPTCDSPFGRVETPSRVKRPLSSFTTDIRPGRARRNTPDDTLPASIWQPATTVASFTWPSVCRTLCQLHGPQFDRVAQQLIRQSADTCQFIGVLGLFPGCGATTTLLCLAARLAADARRTIVVESNFIAPRLAEWLDAEPTAWWQDVLEQGTPVADAVVRSEDDHLDLLPLGAKTPRPLRLAATPRVADTAATLRRAYDLALVDLGAFFDPESQPIALQIARRLRIDALLAVAGPQPADSRDLATLDEYFGASGCPLLGTIENRVAEPPTSTHST